MERRLRRTEWVAVGVAVVLILLVTLWPSRVDAPIDGTLQHTLLRWHGLGLPAFVDYDFVQTAANVLLFAPLGALLASVFVRPLWWVSGVLGLTLSLSVEFAQYTLLPARLASAGDLASNTAGALLGGALVALARARGHGGTPNAGETSAEAPRSA
ncbi:VanZ family protein [Frondihabitans peucedani]|uniref:VanZ-like domain-containing protein n=1 Tax=Frondihabitans peucedani TaxID=598626 RepID=A0ABP8E453_9MICO